MSNPDIKTVLPPLPNPCEYAYVEGRAMQGSEYRRLSGYDPDSAMFSPDQMRAYAEAAVLAASAPAQEPVAGKEWLIEFEKRIHLYGRACNQDGNPAWESDAGKSLREHLLTLTTANAGKDATNEK